MLRNGFVSQLKYLSNCISKTPDLLASESIIGRSVASISTSSQLCDIRGSRRIEYLKKKEHKYPIVPPKLTTKFQDYYTPRVTYRKSRRTRTPSPKPHQHREKTRSYNLREQLPDEEAKQLHDELQISVANEVNAQLKEEREGRLFAVIHSLSRQYLVKSEDVIIIRGHFPPQLGEAIRFEKVLLVGGSDFSLVGRPLLPRDQVCVTGTVVEKTFSNTRINLKAERRDRSRKFNFKREPYVYVRINNISVINEVDRLPDVRGVEGKVFGDSI